MYQMSVLTSTFEIPCPPAPTPVDSHLLTFHLFARNVHNVIILDQYDSLRLISQYTNIVL